MAPGFSSSRIWIVVGAQVLDVRQLRDLPLGDQLADPLDQGILLDPVGDRGDQKGVGPFGVRLVRPAELDRPLAGRVDLPDLLGRVQDHAAGREVGAVDPLEDLLQRQLAVVQQGDQRVADFLEVVRRDVRRHADRDPRHPVDQHVRVLRGEHDRLVGRGCIVGPVVDRLIAQLAQQRLGDRREPALGVTEGGRRIAVDRAEVAVAVDERMPHAERLRHADQRIVDRLVAVRVVGLHHLADDRRALDIPAVGRDVQVVPHRIQDPTLHGLEAVAHVGQGTRRDHAQGVVEVSGARGLGQRDVLDHGAGTPAPRPPRPSPVPLRFAIARILLFSLASRVGGPDHRASAPIQTFNRPVPQSQFPAYSVFAYTIPRSGPPINRRRPKGGLPGKERVPWGQQAGSLAASPC